MVDSPNHYKKDSINEGFLFRILNKAKKKMSENRQKSSPAQNGAVCNDTRNSLNIIC